MTTRRQHWPFILLLVITLPLLLIQLPQAPTPWFDEGINLVAARTLAETGVYGLPSADGLRPADPAIQSGPPLILLLAGLYRIFGASIIVARLVVVILGILTLVALYALAYRLYGLRAAFLTVLIVLALPDDTSSFVTGGFIMQSRQFLGEIPALLFLTLALLLLVRDDLHLKHNILIGLCLGIASALKSQVLVLVVVTLLLRAVYAAGQERETLRRWGIILVVMFAVYGLDMLWRSSMAGSHLAENAEALREGVAIHIFAFRPLANLRELKVLLRLGVLVVGVGGVIALYRTNPHLILTEYGRRRVERFTIVLVTVWIAWYAFASIGWIRYAFIGLMLSTLLLGRLGAWLWQRLPRRLDRAIYAALMLAGVGVILFNEVPLLRNSESDDFYAMMAYLRTEIPTHATILTWEWPAAYLTDHSYLMPETRVTNAITAATFMRDRYRYDPALFDPLRHCPRYVLYGSFRVDRTVLGYALRLAHLVPVYSVGDYELYQIPPDSYRYLPGGAWCARNAVG